MSAFRYLSVCSGIEAASVAWKPLGWECAGVSEIEPFPRAVLQERLGAVPVDYADHRRTPGSNITPMFGDFTQIQEHHVGPINLLVGGTPCQSFSVAGKRAGLDDPRGNLTLEFLALAQRVRPEWILWENVPGVLSHDEGRTMGTFLGLLGECGFRWAYRVLDAQYTRVGRFGRAVPQRRRRVFVVGYSGTGDLDPRAVLFDRESLRGNPAPRREQGQGVATDVAPSLVSSGRGVGRTGETRGQDPVVAVNDCRPSICSDVAPTLNAAFADKQGLEDQHINGGGACSSSTVAMCLNAGAMGRLDAESETLIPVNRCGFDEGVAHSLRGEGFDASEDGTGRGTPLVTCYGLATQQEPKWAEGVCPTLQVPSKSGGGQPHCAVYAIQERAVSENPDAGPQGKGYQAICFTAKDYGADATDDCSPKRRAGGHTGSHANAGVMPAIAFPTEMSATQCASTEELSPALSVGHTTAVAFDMRDREGGAMPEGPHETANIRAADGGSSRSYVAETWAVRRLTPTECARLQGFPDDWARIPWRGKPAEQCPDGPQYKAYGNSMATNVMSWIGERIAAVDAIGGGK